jgi:hypothetical protein
MKQISVDWAGKTYTVKEDQAFALAEEIEDIITLAELGDMGEKPKFIKLSRCYAAVVNFAGGYADPKEVHSEIMASIKGEGPAGKADMLANLAGGLIDMLMDGAPEPTGDGDNEDDEKKR